MIALSLLIPPWLQPERDTLANP